MPFQGLPWTEFISCPVCFKVFNEKQQRPISLGCGHTVCKSCIRNRLNDNRCPFDQSMLPSDVDKLPANFALMHLVGAAVPEQEKEATKTVSDNPSSYEQARKCIEEMAVHLKPLAENLSDDDSSTCSDTLSKDISSNNKSSTSAAAKCVLSRPMQRKLISLIHCQLLEEEGRSRAARIARSLGERIVSELLVSHQYPHQLSANLWAAVRTRGCQFLGPAMQEEVLKLILLALEDGSFLSRKVLVLFVVQRLEARYPQASKTAIGHVVQLLYRASCFKVLKRDEESSLMQLKDAFRQYESLRREHDSQIVQIAIEAGLRISPEQWSSLLYGDPAHKSHMQSIIDKHQSPQSFSQSIVELMLILQRGSDPSGLQKLQPQLEFLSNVDPSPDCPAPSWENLEAVMRSLNTIMTAFVKFLSNPDHRSRLEVAPIQNTRYKTSMCRDFTARGTCPRGNTCTFAHSQEELERYRSRSRRNGNRGAVGQVPEKTSSSLSASESDQLKQVQQISKLKIQAAVQNRTPITSDSVAELLDLKNTPSSPGLSKHVLSQSEAPRALPQQRFNLPPQTQILDPEKPPFIPPGPQNLSNTQLTFSNQAVDAPQIPHHPGIGHQSCFHPHQTGGFPHGQTPYPQSIIMQRPKYQVPFNPQALRMPQFPMQPMNVSPPMRQPLSQIPCGSAVLGPSPLNGIQGSHCLRPQFMPSSAPGELSMPPVNMPSATVQQAMDISDMGNEDVSYVQVNQMGGTDPAMCHSPQMMPFPVQGDSLKDLDLRKKKIISDIREEPVFMSPSSTVYLADSPKAGFAGLKTVLGNNKRTQEPMPKSVSDMFVATRSTQSLDELKNDDLLPSDVEWSNVEDRLSDSCGALAASIVDDLVTSGNNLKTLQTSSVSFSDAISCPDTEFSSFPHDGSDECFIPFEVTSVSKFGPISRMSRVKTNNCAPVQVTADVACKQMTPVLAVTPLERPVSSTMPVPSRFSFPSSMEPSVKPTPTESPSVWQHIPQPSYQNIAMLKTVAAEAVTNSEKLAYELQAVELEISMKTGREPQPVGKMIQDAVMRQQQPAQSGSCHHGSALVASGNSNSAMVLMGRGHVTDCLTNIEAGGSLVSPQRAAQLFMDDYHRSWQGVKK